MRHRHWGYLHRPRKSTRFSLGGLLSYYAKRYSASSYWVQVGNWRNLPNSRYSFETYIGILNLLR